MRSKLERFMFWISIIIAVAFTLYTFQVPLSEWYTHIATRAQ